MENKKPEAVAEYIEGKARSNISQQFPPWRDYVVACKDFLYAAKLYASAGKIRDASKCLEDAIKCQEFVNTVLIN